MLFEVIKLSLFKPRTRLGFWLDQRNVTQEWLALATKLDRKTISRLCNMAVTTPKDKTKRRIINVLKEVDSRVNIDHFWNNI